MLSREAMSGITISNMIDHRPELGLNVLRAESTNLCSTRHLQAHSRHGSSVYDIVTAFAWPFPLSAAKMATHHGRLANGRRLAATRRLHAG